MPGTHTTPDGALVAGWTLSERDAATVVRALRYAADLPGEGADAARDLLERMAPNRLPLIGGDDPRGTLVVVDTSSGPDVGLVLGGWTDREKGEDVWRVRTVMAGDTIDEDAGACLVIDHERLADLAVATGYPLEIILSRLVGDRP